jgi:hypothetical protein
MFSKFRLAPIERMGAMIALAWEGLMRVKSIAVIAFAGVVAGCVTTSMQGYADKDLPAHPIAHVAALVVAPLPLAQSLQADLTTEAAKANITIEDALTIFPPTRQYANDEIKRELKDRGIDGVLVVNVGDTGVMQQYAGTVLSGSYSGSVVGSGVINNYGGFSTASYSGASSGIVQGSAVPIYRQSRQTTFSATLSDPATGRNLWVGKGEIDASGRLFVGTDTGASKTVQAILSDWQAKGITQPPS